MLTHRVPEMKNVYLSTQLSNISIFIHSFGFRGQIFNITSWDHIHVEETEILTLCVCQTLDIGYNLLSLLLFF